MEGVAEHFPTSRKSWGSKDARWVGVARPGRPGWTWCCCRAWANLLPEGLTLSKERSPGRRPAPLLPTPPGAHSPPFITPLQWRACPRKAAPGKRKRTEQSWTWGAEGAAHSHRCGLQTRSIGNSELEACAPFRQPSRLSVLCNLR